MFRDAVAGFANEEVRPRVQQMERDGKIDPALITKFFEMGLMGIEVADEYGGADGSLFMVAHRRRGDQQGRSRRGDPDGRAEHARQLSDSQLRQRPHQVDVPAAAHGREGRRVRALRAELRIRRVRHADARRAARRSLDSQRPQDVDHQRRRSADLRRVRERESVGGLQGHHGVRRRARIQGIQRRQEGRQARHPRVEHDGADPRRRRSARRERARPGGTGLQDRDRDAERRTHRDRRADDRRRRRRAAAPRPNT